MEKLLIICTRDSILCAFLNSHLSKKYELVGVLTTRVEEYNLVPFIGQTLDIPIFDGSCQTEECLAWLDTIKPTVAIMGQYDLRLPQAFISRFKWILNAHPSDLPEFRGPYPIEAGILYNKPLIVSVHHVELAFDKGPVVLKSEKIHVDGLPIHVIRELIEVTRSRVLMQALEMMHEGGVVPIPQDHSKASFCKFLDIFEKIKINWEEDDVFSIERMANATTTGALSNLRQIGKKKIFEFGIKRAKAFAGIHELLFGSIHIITVNDLDVLRIAGKGGFLLIEDFCCDNAPEDSIDFKNYYCVTK